MDYYPNLVTEREILIAFACGHVFHLSHLHPESQQQQQQQSPTDGADRPADQTPRAFSPSEETTASRTVGPKVTTARLLRDKIGDGCRICSLTREIESLGAESGV